MSLYRAVAASLASALVVALAACSGGRPGDAGAAAPAPVASASPAAGPTVAPPAVPAAAAVPDQKPSPEPSDSADPRSRAASLSMPAIGVKDLRVVPYEGTTDDWPGTRIQDRGVAASPYGDEGGVGPGERGNYLVTAHRLSAGGPLRDLPSLDEGDMVYVEFDGTVYAYEIIETRTTSFRSERSLAEQRAAVPGSPGEKPTEAMITISTCATPEDDAAGNFWRDAKGNPEHRIDKIGVLRGKA
ncbi:class E sortase [Streptomyces sp. HNM0663]|uniref:Class E sortase n=1 Tax=Streptomyces chengmaiensis TaxID=3040919 RepID=A0ABT6HW66_9ACTN|nr:class E sortase [Streptomyces chengmaiensis]MDH2392523.1 class E sortase [Streptomyces chengmaiensis]